MDIPADGIVLPTADDAEELYNVLMAAHSVVDELRIRVLRATESEDGSDLPYVVDFAGIGAVAAIAADVRLRAKELSEMAGELDDAIFELDAIRRLS